MSNISDWSDTIRRIGEDNERKMQEHLALFDAQMPDAIALLPTHPADELLELFTQFIGCRSDPRETAKRQEFLEHIKLEITRRMLPPLPQTTADVLVRVEKEIAFLPKVHHYQDLLRDVAACLRTYKGW